MPKYTKKKNTLVRTLSTVGQRLKSSILSHKSKRKVERFKRREKRRRRALRKAVEAALKTIEEEEQEHDVPHDPYDELMSSGHETWNISQQQQQRSSSSDVDIVN
jgi:arginyl-tRNA synthetase